MCKFSIEGFRFNAVSAEVKKIGLKRLDFGLIASEQPSIVAGVTTQNLVHAAPVTLTRTVLQTGNCQAALINSGNANAYTGALGLQDAETLVATVASGLSIPQNMVIPMSTGVIGARLPVERMRSRIPELVNGLSQDKFGDVARAIMTTDTVPKTVEKQAVLSNGPIRIVGMCKGAGMIAPNMATMLAILLTDIRVEHGFLTETFKKCCDVTFNRVTVDGDTSTNDTAILMSGGAANCRMLSDLSNDREIFYHLLREACQDLAEQIVKDGEGATKLVEINVSGASDDRTASVMARKIAESPLVKTAFHGEDPNWGRIICAAGHSGVMFDPSIIDLSIGDVKVVVNGQLDQGNWEERAHAVMSSDRFVVSLDLKNGTGNATILTTDFSEEYVTINADYRS